MSKRKFIIITATITLLVSFLLPLRQKGYLDYKLFQIEVTFNGIYYFAENQLALVVKVLNNKENIKINIPFYRQEHPLTCEVSALRMVLNYYGLDVTEEDLLNQLVFDTKEPMTKDNIWGDPDKGFVGDISGSIFFGTGYGVYEEPIKDLALNYKQALVLKYTNLSDIMELTENGYPVIVWGLLSNKKSITWQTSAGKDITAFPGEHARVIMGYVGDISKPKKIILMDPLYGKISMDTDKFLAEWKMLGNKAVVVY